MVRYVKQYYTKYIRNENECTIKRIGS